MSSEVEWGNWAPYKGSKPDYSFSELADQEYEHFNKSVQIGKQVIGATDAYDRRNDDVFKATGEKLFNPLRDIPSADDLAEMQAAYRAHVGAGNVDKSRADFQVEWFAQRYDQRLKDIATKHPNHQSVIQADRSPVLDAMEAAQASDRKAADLAERLGMVDVRQSSPSLKYVPILPDVANFAANMVNNPKATVAQFWGGFKAQMSNPVEASMNLAGFGAGRASMSVLKTAMLNAAANGAIEAIAQPMRQYESKQLGLDYGWDRFFADVSGAAGTGFVLDAAIRGPYRAGITRFGKDVPEGQAFSKHGRGGLFQDAIPQMDPIKPVVREKITPEELERARANDIDAIESIAKKSGIYDDPSIKGMIDYAKLGGRIDDEMVKRFEAMKIDHGEGMATLKAAIEVGGLGYARMPDPIPQATRALDTAGAAELAPRLAEIDQRLAEAPQNVRQAIRAGIEAGIPEIVDAARKAVSGDLEGMRKAIADAGGEQVLTDRVIVHTATNPISVAMALRRSPQVMDSNVSLRTDMMRMARAIAALDEPAFRMVLEGKAHPLAGQIVADMVPPGRHAQVLEQVANFRSMEDAKAAIPDLIPEPSRAPEATGTKVSDPAGPEAKAQIEDLEKAHKAEVDRATEPARKREELESKVETLKGEIAKLEEQQGKLFALSPMTALNKVVEWAKSTRKAAKKTDDQLAADWSAENKSGGISEKGDGYEITRSAKGGSGRYDYTIDGKSVGHVLIDQPRRLAPNFMDMMLSRDADKLLSEQPFAGTITRIEVDDTHQNKGIATKLLNVAEADLARHGAILHPGDTNMTRDFIRLYAKRDPDILRDAFKRMGVTRYDDASLMLDTAMYERRKKGGANLMAALSDRGKASLDETILSPPEQKLLAKLTERTGLKPDDIAEQRAQGQSFGKKIDAALDKATKFEGAEKAADELATKRQELRAAERELEQVQLDQARTLQDQALFNAVMRRAALQRQLDVRRAIDDALRLGDQMLPEGTRVEVRTDEMVDPASGYRLDASSDMATGDIALASYAMNPAGRIGHEGVHTLITKGHVAPEEVKLLAKMARERGLFKDEAKYREAYATRDNLDALIDEEAAAHAIEARINGTDIGPANTMADRIKQLIERIKNALDGYGFKTADDVARAIIEGRAAEREARAEWMRNNGETAFAIADTNTGRSMRADLDRLGYYSKALEAAKGLKQAKGTPEQMLAQLKAAGVKDAEIEATNLRSFLDGKTSITRDEIVKHLTENRVGVREVGYGFDSARTDELNRTATDLYNYSRSRGLSDEEANAILESIGAHEEGQRYAVPKSIDTPEGRRFVDAALNAWRDVPAKWSSYSLDPSNPTYRETVLHLPSAAEQRLVDAALRRSEIDRELNSFDRMAGRENQNRYVRLVTEWQAISRDADAGNSGMAASDFRSGHFSEPNIIGHMMTSLNKHEGKPVFTLDQIQSDWGQKIRDEAGVRNLPLGSIDAQKAYVELLEARVADAQREYDAALTASKNESSVAKFLNSGRRDSAVEQAEAHLRSMQDIARMARAELNTKMAAATGHPLVNTTDQWTITTLRRALRQAAEADAEFIAIPTGDTVLSYNPGDENGMRQFYGSVNTETHIPGIVPKNLRKLLEKIDKEASKPTYTSKLETPTYGMKGEGFTLFPLTDKVKRSVMEEGQALFALSREPLDMSPEARKARAEQMGFDTGKVWYHGTTKDFDAFDPKKANKANGMPRAVFLAEEPSTANYFARSQDGSRAIPVYLKRGEYFDFRNEEHASALEKFLDGKASSEIVPGYLGSPKASTFIDSMKRGDWGILERPAVQKWLKKNGYVGWFARESADGPLTVAVTDPTNIRSVNATFDPAEAGSARLMAAFNDNTLPVSRFDQAKAKGFEIPEFAAFRVGDQVFTGRDHSGAIRAAEHALERRVEQGGEAEGFVTTSGRFVTRAEAAELANKAGLREPVNIPGWPEELHSSTVRDWKNPWGRTILAALSESDAAVGRNTPPDPLKSDMAVVDRLNQLKELIEACR